MAKLGAVDHQRNWDPTLTIWTVRKGETSWASNRCCNP